MLGSLVAGREMHHLVGSAMVSGAGMDEDTGDIAVLSPSFTGTSEHDRWDRRNARRATAGCKRGAEALRSCFRNYYSE